MRRANYRMYHFVAVISIGDYVVLKNSVGEGANSDMLPPLSAVEKETISFIGYTLPTLQPRHYTVYLS